MPVIMMPGILGRLGQVILYVVPSVLKPSTLGSTARLEPSSLSAKPMLRFSLVFALVAVIDRGTCGLNHGSIKLVSTTSCEPFSFSPEPKLSDTLLFD